MPTRWAAAVLVVALLLPRVDLPFEIWFPTDPGKVEFVSSFGYPRSGGRRHKGNDLMIDKLAPVYAVADGVVTRATVSGLSGRYIRIDHGDGWASYYMHLNNDSPGTDDGDAPWEAGVLVEVGQKVVAGELIGYVGDSGNAEWTDPHLHFELRWYGDAIDPYETLVEARGRAISAHLKWLVRRFWELSAKNLQFPFRRDRG